MTENIAIYDETVVYINTIIYVKIIKRTIIKPL